MLSAARARKPRTFFGDFLPWSDLRRASRWPASIMTLTRLMLFVLTALAAVGAIYFWAIHVAATAMLLLILVLLCLVGAVLVNRGKSR